MTRLTKITASSSFMELSMSKPPSFHSPLSVMNTVDDLMYPWTELASLFMNLITFWALLKHCAFAAAATYGDAMQAPLYRLLGHALPLDLPRRRGKSFSGNVDVLFGLVATVNLGISLVAAATDLKSVKDLDQTRVSEGPEFAECIAGERELGTVSGNIEGEDAALGAIFLYRRTVSRRFNASGIIPALSRYEGPRQRRRRLSSRQRNRGKRKPLIWPRQRRI
jgi:hypothetical protein